MTAHAIATAQCAHCGTDFAGTGLFCTSCGKPNRNQSTGVNDVHSRPSALTGAASLTRGPVLPSQQRPRAHGSSAVPLPASFSVSTAKEPLSWEMLLIWSVVSFGIVAIVYAFKQASWAKRLDVRSTALTRLMAGIAFLIVGYILAIVASVNAGLEVVSLFALLLLVMGIVFVVLYAVSMTDTITAVGAYNQVPTEPSKILAIVLGSFSAVYFQYHINTIEAHCSATRP